MHWKRESDQMLYILFSEQSGKRVSEAEEVESKRWQIGSLATCVPRTLLIKEAFPFTDKPTVETRSSIVHSATSHLAKLVV